MKRRRLDAMVVELGLADSRKQAQALIMAGEVMVGERVIDKAGALVPEGVGLRLREGLTYVSRGGLKLAGALEEFGLEAAGLVCLDIGASTGGFTDCLLQHGAARVYALDVGYGQLHYRLRREPRVVVMERVNAHYPFSLPEKVHLVTVDVSFISAARVAENALPWLKEGGRLLVLLKPQFEVGRGQVGKGGVVREPRLHALVLERFLLWGIGQGLRLGGIVPSPLLGPAGNREFFVLWAG